jgi:hypothetical protein
MNFGSAKSEWTETNMRIAQRLLLSAIWLLLLTSGAVGAQPGVTAGVPAEPPLLKPQRVSTQFPTQDVVIASIVLDPPTDEGSDACPRLQQAIDRAAEAGGAVVFLNSGHYPIRTRLVLREGVVLRGDWAPVDRNNGVRGTVLDIYAGRDEPDGEPVITMQRGSGVCNLSIWYPEQRADNPTPCAWTLRTSGTVAGNNTTVQNVTLVNPYQGIKIGPEANELHTIRNVQMTPLRLGISVDSTTDIGRLSGVDISPSCWTDSRLPGCPASPESRNALRETMRTSATGVEIGRSDWEYIYQVAVDSCDKGFAFRRGLRGLTNAVMYGCVTQRCRIGLEAAELNRAGLSATACSFNGSEACVLAPETFSTVVQFHTCSFAGPAEDGVHLKGRGLLTFQNCTFEGWSANAIVAFRGMVSALGCDFRGPASHVVLGPGVERGRLLGNAFAGKPDVRNSAAPADVQISHLAMDFAKPDVSPHRESPFPRPASNRVFVATDFGLRADAGDNGPALQRALDSAGAAGGGTVYVPAGNYKFTREITVPSHVELRGIFDVPHHTISAGSVLMPICGRGRDSGTPFMQLSPGAGVRGITVWYPEQDPAAPVAFPWTVRALGPKCWLIDVTLGNPYQAVDFWTHPSTGHVIRYLAGSPLRKGLWVSQCAGDGWVEDVQFNPHYALRLHRSLPKPGWTRGIGDKLINYQREHLEAMVFGSCRREHMRGNFLYAAFDGLAFRGDDGGTNARVFHHGSDTASRAVVLDHTGPDGVEFINGQLVPLGNWAQAAIVTTPKFDGGARFFNSQVWAGPRTARLDGTGHVLIQQINTVSGGVVVADGQLALQNANFEIDLDPHLEVTGSDATVDLVAAMYRGGVFKKSTAAAGRLTALASSASLPIDPSLLPGPGSGPSNLSYDWEADDVPFIADKIARQGGGVRTVSNGTCRIASSSEAHGGGQVVRIRGNADGQHSFVYFHILDGPVSIFPDSVLSYRVFPVNAKGRHAGIDIRFTDGSTLRESGIDGAHPGAAKGPVGKWSECRFRLGTRLAGKTIEKVMCAYDSTVGPGAFEALFDDLRIRSAMAPELRLTASLSPAPGTYPAGTAVTFDVPDGCRVRYTLGGLNPRGDSPIFDRPIVLDSPGHYEIRAVLQREDGSLSPVLQSGLYSVE